MFLHFRNSQIWNIVDEEEEERIKTILSSELCGTFAPGK